MRAGFRSRPWAGIDVGTFSVKLLATQQVVGGMRYWIAEQALPPAENGKPHAPDLVAHAIARVTADPQVVEVRGPTDAVSSLREVSTRPIDVSGLSESLERHVDLDLPRGVELSGSPSIRAVVTVVSSTERRQLENVPVYLWPGHEGWRVDPDRITVILEGPVDELRTVRSDQVAAFAQHLVDALAPDDGQPFDVLQIGRHRLGDPDSEPVVGRIARDVGEVHDRQALADARAEREIGPARSSD